MPRRGQRHLDVQVDTDRTRISPLVIEIANREQARDRQQEGQDKSQRSRPVDSRTANSTIYKRPHKKGK